MVKREESKEDAGWESEPLLPKKPLLHWGIGRSTSATHNFTFFQFSSVFFLAVSFGPRELDLALLLKLFFYS